MDWTRLILYGFFVYVFWSISGSGIFPEILFPFHNGMEIECMNLLPSFHCNYSLENNEFKIKAIGSPKQRKGTCSVLKFILFNAIHITHILKLIPSFAKKLVFTQFYKDHT